MLFIQLLSIIFTRKLSQGEEEEREGAEKGCVRALADVREGKTDRG